MRVLRAVGAVRGDETDRTAVVAHRQGLLKDDHSLAELVMIKVGTSDGRPPQIDRSTSMMT